MKSFAPLTSATVALATLLIASTTTAASADARRTGDPRGDVWEVVDSSAGPQVLASDRVLNVDLEKVTMKVGQRIVVIRGFYSDLFLDPDVSTDSVEFWLELRSNKWTYRTISLTSDRSDPGGNVKLTGEAGVPTTCLGLNHYIDRDVDRVSIRVPVRCLGRPAWLKHKAWGYLRTEDGSLFVDPAGTGQAEHARWSPRISRG